MAKGAGAPRKYRSVKAMQEAIDAYFASCEGHILKDTDGTPITDKFGNVVIVGEKPPTITGLALALGFASRQALLNYQGRPEFNDAVTRAKSRVEAYVEERLFDRDGTHGAQFSLRNNFSGWKGELQENNAALERLDDILKDFKNAVNTETG